jgi:hypothetical protein
VAGIVAGSAKESAGRVSSYPLCSPILRKTGVSAAATIRLRMRAVIAM